MVYNMALTVEFTSERIVNSLCTAYFSPFEIQKIHIGHKVYIASDVRLTRVYRMGKICKCIGAVKIICITLFNKCFGCFCRCFTVPYIKIVSYSSFKIYTYMVGQVVTEFLTVCNYAVIIIDYIIIFIKAFCQILIQLHIHTALDKKVVYRI